MNKVIILFIGFSCLIQMCCAQDSITTNDVKVIKAKSETTIERYLNTLLNTISYTGAESSDIRELIAQSVEGSDKKIFLNGQIAIADDISDPNYTNGAGSNDVPVAQYLNAVNTFYAKSDTNSIFFSDIRSSAVKKGRNNIYINVYFTSTLKNKCLANPNDPYKPSKRVAELFVQKSNNKWQVFISRIGFFSPADTVTDMADNIAIIDAGKQIEDGSKPPDVAPAEIKKEGEKNEAVTQAFNQKMADGDKAFANRNYVLAREAYLAAYSLRPNDPAPRAMLSKLPLQTETDRFNQYIEQARFEEKKRNYQTAIGLYNKAIDVDPKKRSEFEPRIKELNTSFRILSDLEEKYRSGNYKAAIKGYSEHLRKPKANTDFSNSDYYLGRAKCYDRMGQATKSYNEQIKNYNDALEDYVKSYEYDNDNMETIRSRADLYRRMNRNVEALTEYKTYLAKDPTEISIYEAMADLHMLNGNIDQAIKDLDGALSQETIDPIFKAKLNIDKGILYAKKMDYDNANDFFTKAISLDSNNAFAYYNRGMGKVRLNNIQSAADDFTIARRKGLDSSNIKKIDSSAEIIFTYGLKEFGSGHNDSALVYIDAASRVNPFKSYYYYAKGECLFAKNDFDRAIEAYSRAIQLSSNYHEAYYKRGLANLQMEKPGDAINDFNKTLQYNPQFYLAQKGIGDAYFSQKNYKSCISSMEACLEMSSLKKANSNNTVAEIYNTIGKAQYNLNDLDKALDNFSSAEKKNENFAEAHFNRGLAYYKKNNFNDATKEIREAISIENNHAEWHYYLGRALQDGRHYEDAIASYRNAIALDSAGRFRDATYYVGLSNYRIKNYQNALDSYRKFLTIQPNGVPPSFNYELGNIYLNMRQYDSAYNYLVRCYQSDSSNGYFLYSMASCIYLRGNTEESLKWFEKSFRTNKVEKSFVDHDALLGTLQDDKRFRDLKKKYL